MERGICKVAVLVDRPLRHYMQPELAWEPERLEILRCALTEKPNSHLFSAAKYVLFPLCLVLTLCAEAESLHHLRTQLWLS